MFEVDNILGKRRAGNGTGGGFQYLVKWKDAPLEQSTWQPTKNLMTAQFHLRLFQRQNQESLNKIELIYDKFTPNYAHTRHNMKNSGYMMNRRTPQIFQNQPSKKQNKAEETEEQDQDKTPLQILGMNRQDGKYWFYYQKLGIRGWTSREYLIKNYPDELLQFYLANIHSVEQLDEDSNDSLVCLQQKEHSK